jgi:hypothetical protein
MSMFKYKMRRLFYDMICKSPDMAFVLSILAPILSHPEIDNRYPLKSLWYYMSFAIKPKIYIDPGGADDHIVLDSDPDSASH